LKKNKSSNNNGKVIRTRKLYTLFSSTVLFMKSKKQQKQLTASAQGILKITPVPQTVEIN
jgi:hypothetical protein